MKRFNCVSNLMISLPNRFLPVICSNFPKRDDNQGIMVNDANRDNKVEIIMVTQNWVMILDTRPLLMAMGKKTTTITSVMDVTVQRELHVDIVK